jgi:hypothetical protein
MRRLIIATLFMTAAIAAPLGAQAVANDRHPLAITLVKPVIFGDPTADCLGGVATYRISIRHKIGTGTNCLVVNPILVDCPPNVTADFCQNAPVRMTLNLRGGTIKADATIFEVWTCTATCAIDQRYSGTVTSATRRFHELVGGSVSGGGVATLDPANQVEPVMAIDEVLVISQADTDDKS